METRIAGPRVLDPVTGESLPPAEYADLQAERVADRLAALRIEVQDRRPTPWGYFRELQDRVTELERRLGDLEK